MHQLLCLPIEFYKREFLARLHLALIACKDNYQVLIGQQNEYTFKHVKDGIIFHKDHAPSSEWTFEKYKKNRMKTCALDEEALIIIDLETYIHTRVSAKLMENLDAIFLWGQNHYNNLQPYKRKPNLYIVGSPKFDLCELERDKFKVPSNSKIKNILINTRFTYNNTFRHGDNAVYNQFIEMGYFRNEEKRKSYKELYKSEVKIFNEFVKLINLIGNDEKFQLVIRPHPAEDFAFYNELTKNYVNIVVDNSTSLNTQILRTDCVIHDSCTTAIESRAMDKVVFGLRPANLKVAYDDSANAYSLNFNEAEKLYDYIKEINCNQIKQPEIEGEVTQSIFNWKNKKGSASYGMLEVFKKLRPKPIKTYKKSIFEEYHWRKILYKVLDSNQWIVDYLKHSKNRRLKHIYDAHHLINHKFPDYNLNEVKKAVINLCNLDRKLGKPNDFELKKVTNKLLHITYNKIK